MFNQTKYTSLYYKIVTKAKNENRKKSKNLYFESHHMMPRSLGGDNSKSNLVLLTAREHYLCHWLLTKMVIKPKDKKKMHHAFWCMARTTEKQEKAGKKISSKQYEVARKYVIPPPRRVFDENEKRRQSLLIKKSWENDTERKMKLSERSKKNQTGIPKPEKTKMLISQSLSGVKHPQWRNERKSQRQKRIYEIEKITGEKFQIKGLGDWISQTEYSYNLVLKLKKGLIESYMDLKSIKQL